MKVRLTVFDNKSPMITLRNQGVDFMRLRSFDLAQ